MENIQCDKCKHVFKIKLYTRKHQGDIEEVYLKCPKCRAEHTSYVTDAWAREEQQKIKQLNDEKISRQGVLSHHMDKLRTLI